MGKKLVITLVLVIGVVSLLLPVSVHAAPADAYWVGGSGNWSDAATHWSDSDGGAPNAANLPDSTSNVWFTANSDTGAGFQVTLTGTANCKDFDSSGTDVVLTLYTYSGGTAYTTNIYGSLNLKSTTIITPNYGGAVTMKSTSTGKTITTAGVAITSGLTFNGIGGEWTLQDDVTIPNGGNPGFTITNGSLVTNNKTLNLTFDQSGGVVTMGTSSLTTTSFTSNGGTGTYSTSTITVNGNTFSGGGKTYGIVSITGSAIVMAGANTFATLSIVPTAASTSTFTTAADLVISGTLTVTGKNSSTYRMTAGSSVVGTQRQITAGVVAITNCNISDWAGVGAADWDISAGMNSDMGGNLGITFTVAQNNFWVGNSGNYSDITHWASTTGGVGGTGRIPLIQDTAIFDANSFSIPGRTVTIDVTNLGGIDTNGAVANGITPTSVTNSPTFSSAAQVDIYGSFNFGGATWTNAAGGTWFKGANTIGITGTGVYTFTSNVYISTNSTYMTSVNFTTDFTIVGIVYLRSGVLCLQGFNVTAKDFDSSTTTQVRALNLSTGTFTLNDTAATTKWNVDATNMSLYCGTSTIVLTNSGANGQTFTPGTGLVYYNLTIAGAGDYTTTFSASFTSNQVYIDRSVAHKTISGNVTLTVTTGLFAPKNGIITVTIANVDVSKSSGTVVLDYLNFNSGANTCTAAGGATFYAGSHSITAPQTGWNFSDPVAPTVTTTSVTNILSTSATFTGDISDLGGYGTVYGYFQYGTDITFASYSSTTPKTALTLAGSFTFTASGLSTASTYYMRAVASDGMSDLANGSTISFTVGLPIVETGAANVDVPNLTAVLNGTITDLGIFSNVVMYFEWGKTISYGNTTAQQSANVAPYGFDETISGLIANTNYHFRAVVLYNGTDKVYGSDATFSTSILAGSTMPNDIQAHLIVVDRNLLTDSLVTYDRIYIVQYDLIYDIYPTDFTAKDSYIFQLLDTGGNLLGSQLCYPYFNRGYGQGVVAFYFPAAGAPAWGGAYTLRITGNPTIFTGTLPSKDFVLDSSNYTTLSVHADTQAFMCTTIIRIAEDLEQEWQTTLLSQEDPGTVLSATGEAYFRSAIPNIQNLAPCLFYIQDISVDTSTRAWDTSLGDTYKTRLDGTFIKSGFQGLADTLNIPLVLIYGGLCLIACVWLIYQSQKRFQTAVPGYVGSLMVILCAGIMVLGFTLISIVALVLVIAAGWLLFMRRA